MVRFAEQGLQFLVTNFAHASTRFFTIDAFVLKRSSRVIPKKTSRHQSSITVCVCVHACVDACMCVLSVFVYARVCACACVDACMCVCVCACVDACMCVCACVCRCMHVCVCACVDACMCVCFMCVCAFMCVCMSVYIPGFLGTPAGMMTTSAFFRAPSSCSGPRWPVT